MLIVLVILLVLIVIILLIVLVILLVLLLIVEFIHKCHPTFCNYCLQWGEFYSRGEIMALPEQLKLRLREVFGAYSDGMNPEELFELPNFKGIRVNTLKTNVEKFLKYNIAGEKSPFCAEGFYVGAEDKLGRHPLHHAGAFYVQEPSATSAVTVLKPEKGDYILDLCAAPGGKSTQIAAALQNTGLIWSNEIVSKRAYILLSNFERMGVARGVVSNCHPDTLCEELYECFDKVLVDAPCSGEGMLRHDPQIATEWTEENVTACAERQLKILDSAAKALRPGGELVYSTCTYSEEENEKNILKFLQAHPEFTLENSDVSFGREGIGLPEARRILWQDGGEGHFVAKLKKGGNATRREIPEFSHFADKKQKKGGKAAPIDNQILLDFLKENGIILPDGNIINKNDKFYLSPIAAVNPRLGIIRSGVLLGETDRGRFIPAHAMFATPYIAVPNTIDLQLSDPRLQKFLHGEEIEAEAKKGFARVCVEGIPLGFGKCSGGRLKNYYPKGLRTL